MVQPAQSHSFPRLLLLLSLALLFLATPASASNSRIARSKSRLNARQTNGQTSFQTVETSNTPTGVVTQTCTVVLTPIVDASGADMVEMTKTCTITVTPLNGSEPPPPSTSTSFIGAPPPATDVPPAQPSATDAPPPDPGTSDVPPTPSASDAPPPAASTTDTPPPDGASSSDSAAVPSETSAPSDAASSQPPASASDPATPTSAEVIIPSSIVDIGNDGTGGQTSAAAGANAGPDLDALGTTMMAASEASLIATAVSANAPASTTAAAAANFELPGQHLEVLPIGLGVFAGVSVIALIVVGLVTYERTKYRKAFRERTMRAQNAGYGTTNAV